MTDHSEPVEPSEPSEQSPSASDPVELPPQSQFVAPIRDRVFVRRKESLAETPGGIYIPEQHRDVPAEGTVIAVGDGRILPNGTSIPLVVKVGDHVLFGRFSGSPVTFNREELLMLREDDIFATLRNEVDGNPHGNPLYQDPSVLPLKGPLSVSDHVDDLMKQEDPEAEDWGPDHEDE